MRVCHFEDHGVADLEPLTLTRPVFSLLSGCSSLARKQQRHLAPGPVETGWLVRPYLAELVRHESGDPVNDLAWLRQGRVLLVNGRWLPPAPPAPGWEDVARPCVGWLDGELAWAVLDPDRLAGLDLANVPGSLMNEIRGLERRDAGGRMIRHLWDLVEVNGEQIRLDAWLADPERPRRDSGLPALVGPSDRLLVDPSAHIDPLVVADTTGGPVVIDRDAVVSAFTRLEGPCYIGPGTHLLGAKVRAGTSLGPQCRIGGEVEASIVLGHSNKYHDGFLGHACIGEWVNLGAGTSNSDLRNDYGPVSVTVNGRRVATGQHKVGCFLGDHTKTGLGALLNTGTSVGVFCNLLPTGALLPRHVPSFTSVWNGSLRENVELPALMHTAERVLSRRGKTLTEAHRKLYALLLEQTADERRAAMRDAEGRRLRRSA